MSRAVRRAPSFTTSETPRDSATKSRSIAIRLWLGAAPAEPNALLTAVDRIPNGEG
jgi:hypothetical protein